MRSYKKLIPAYQAFPEDYILTADDDILYPKDLIETTWMTHLHYPEAIIGAWMREPHIENGAAEPYSTWDYIQPEEPQPMPMPVGAAGVFYPPHSLKKEMMEWDLARQYAPQADDIWFWAAGMAVGTKKITPTKRYEVLSFDSIYQYFHSGSSLQSSNVKGHGEMTNDDQIKVTLRFIKENGWIE